MAEKDNNKGVDEQTEAEKLAEDAREQAEAANAQAEEAASHPTKPKKARRPIVLVAVILCSIIMVGSILLPSLSAIVSGVSASSKSAETAAASTEAATTDASTDATTDAASTEAATTNSMLDNIDSRYSGTVEALESKLQSSPDDAATLINLANDYYEWGSYAMSYASTTDDQSHVTDLFTKAMGYYDSYLAQNDASSARADRAMCQYYLGDTAGAQAALEQLTTSAADYAPGWANLGLVYQSQGDTDKATAAYNKALEVDPSNKYGMKSTVTSQLQSLTASTDSATTSSSLADALSGSAGATN